MVHYIRFLKIPQTVVKHRQTYVRALVTVTTDLGETFYPGDCELFAVLLGHNDQVLSPWSVSQWRSTMRNVWIEVKVQSPPNALQDFSILVNDTKSASPDEVTPECVMLSARCAVPFPTTMEPDYAVQRALKTHQASLRIYEEMGESIARHIWYEDCAIRSRKMKKEELTQSQGRLTWLDLSLGRHPEWK